MDAQKRGELTGYLDPVSGASGDMLLGALVAVGVPVQGIQAALAGLGLGLTLQVSNVLRAGLTATKVEVLVDGAVAEHGGHGHPHRCLADIEEILEAAQIHPITRQGARQVFRQLAQAEAVVHGQELHQIHFHEVGALDAIADVVGVVEGFRLLGLDRLWCAPLPMSGGMTRAAHGSIPLPAPATLELVKGLPLRPGPAEFEMVTPTGAALIRQLTQPLTRWPQLVPQRVGLGAGSRDTAHPNVLRLIVGESWEPGPGSDGHQLSSLAADLALAEGSCVLVECNVDDMNPQLFGHVQELLFAAGALEVFFTPVYMKKQRPGTLITVLAEAPAVSALVELLVTETTSIGVRAQTVTRYTCFRQWEEVVTPYGTVRMKLAYARHRVVNAAPEYEDCRRASQAHQVPLKAVQRSALAAWEQLHGGDA